jgi:hypothetical protein
MRFLIPFLLLLAGTFLTGTTAQAQTASGEYWYSFQASELRPGMHEKQLTQAVVDVNPEASVLMDTEAGILVVRTTVPLEVERLLEYTAQLGTPLTLRNRTDIRSALHSAE